jgi:hypothetical protein
MRTLVVVLLALLLPASPKPASSSSWAADGGGGQDQKKDLKAVNEKMAKVKSYHFTIKAVSDGQEKLALEGEYFAPDAIHIRSDKGEFASKGDVKLQKTGDEEWKEPGKLRKKLEAADTTMPHEWVAKMADEAGAIKREKSDKIGSVTVDLYVAAPGGDAAKRAASGHPLWASVVDWTKAENAIIFSVGRDDLYYRVEQRYDLAKKNGSITIEFSDFGRAKCTLPEDVKTKLGIK